MPARYVSFAPLVEVTSAFLNTEQDAVWTQRGTGSANTLAVTIDTPTPLIKQKTVAFAIDNGATSPPVSGLVDNSIDWRDRQLHYQVEYDPTRDIRWGKADDNKQPLVSVCGTFYTRTGGVSLDVSLQCGIYVDTVNGYLWMRKSAGYIRAIVKCTAQLKERS